MRPTPATQSDFARTPLFERIEQYALQSFNLYAGAEQAADEMSRAADELKEVIERQIWTT